MRRRDFLQVAAGTLMLPLAGRLAGAVAATPRPKAPFRVLYNNDLTNGTVCVMPGHTKRQPFSKELLEATVDEVAGTGVEVHLLQPGLGWVPMWPSKVMPLAEHLEWADRTFGLKPDSYDRFLLDGGDIVRAFIDRCRARGQTPFISYRLNDAHMKDLADAKPGDRLPQGSDGLGPSRGISRFYYEHPEYRIGTSLTSWDQRVQNWAIPAVREHKFALIRELCENYDFEGLELDFLRHCCLFQVDRTTAEQRREVIGGFIRDVRQLLDRTTKPNQHRWLCVRIPCQSGAHDRLGIDVEAMAAAGVDMFNLSPYYVMEQQHTDAVAIKRKVPDAAVYVEFTHMTRPGPRTERKGYDDFTFRRATPEQIQTTAHLAYARGLDGLSAFNFVYYREHGQAGRGPFNEPPFSVFNHMGDPAWLARQPQHYFVAQTWDVYALGHKPFGSTRQPLIVKPGATHALDLDMAPPTGGWKTGGRLRLQLATPWQADDQLTVSVNGTALQPTPDVSEPYPNPYPPVLGTPQTLRAWILPASALRDRSNRIEMRNDAGQAKEFVFLDVAVS